MRAWLESRREIAAYTVAGDWQHLDTASLWAHFRTDSPPTGVQNGPVEHYYKRLLDYRDCPLLLVFIGSVTDRGDGRTHWLTTQTIRGLPHSKSRRLTPKAQPLFSGRVPGNTSAGGRIARIGRGSSRLATCFDA